MARKFSELWSAMAPERQARVELKAAEMLAVTDLSELRKASNCSQSELARRLDKQQPAVAKIEARDDLHISTVRDYVEALGGQLVIMAQLPNNETILLKSLSSKTD